MVDYTAFTVAAKCAKVGRPAGGMCTFILTKLKLQQLFMNSYIMLFRCLVESLSIYVISAYLNPTADIVAQLKQIHDIISEHVPSNAMIIMVTDANAHIANVC